MDWLSQKFQSAKSAVSGMFSSAPAPVPVPPPSPIAGRRKSKKKTRRTVKRRRV